MEIFIIEGGGMGYLAHKYSGVIWLSLVSKFKTETKTDSKAMEMSS